MDIRSVAIVGVGLLGGSIGLAIRNRFPHVDVLGIGRSRERLDVAVQCGSISRYLVQPTSQPIPADLVVICSPVDTIAEHAVAIERNSPQPILITDVGSTKASIARMAVSAPCPRFVPAHPMAGSEKQGVEHALAGLFQDRLCLVTPTPINSAELIAKTNQFWQHLGCRIEIMTPEEHDRVLARTSHAPHMVATAMVQALPTAMHLCVGSGFRDTTRLAAGDPTIWRAICDDNATEIGGALAELITELTHLKQLIEEKNPTAVGDYLESAKKVRDDLGS
ncbi:MAG: prephenate dehydrogenase/arogenate dehydrogenase family protein [Zavarzinella sp.]